jgi:hypothetical protein
MKLFRYLNAAGIGITCLAVPLLYIMILLIHVWTVILAYEMSGFLAAVLSFITPPVSWLYWAVVCWRESGTWLNAYTASIAALLCLWVFQIIGGGLTQLPNDPPKDR